MPHSPELSPQERLAISRNALVQHMCRHQRSEEKELALTPDGSEPPAIARAPTSTPTPTPTPTPVGQTWQLLKYAVRHWWYRHPASTVAELAQPLLHDYALAHPFKLLLISAGVGAATVALRPWRMLSIGALLTALKSSGLPRALLSSAPRKSRGKSI